METKICSKCKEEKELTKFSKSKSCKTGYSYWCNSCKKTYSKNRIETGISKDYLKKKRRNDCLKSKCKQCSNKRLDTSKYCMYHFVYSLIVTWKLSKDEIEKTIKGLIEKLEYSEFTCHYSGLKITPGFSASIDHRIPKTKGGTNDLSNLVWSHTQVNKLKNNLSEKEFINSSANILVELNYLDSKGQL